MNISNAIDWTGLLGPVFTLIVGILTVWVLRQQIQISKDLGKRSEVLTRELKRADILQGFNARYDRLWDIRHNPSTIEVPQTFFTRFWSLQLDQFVQWRDDYLANKDYRVWLLQRQGDFHRNWEFKNLKFLDGWEAAKHEMAANSAFVTLIESLRNTATNVDDAMRVAKVARDA